MSTTPDPPRLMNVKRFFVSTTGNDSEAVERRLLSPEVTYTVPGRSAVSGVFHGPEEVMNHLNSVFGISNCTYDVLKWDDWMLGENHISVLLTLQIQRDGAIFRGRLIYLVQTDRNDAISEITVYFEDQEEAHRFFYKA
jgi:hypothetical protein